MQPARRRGRPLVADQLAALVRERRPGLERHDRAGSRARPAAPRRRDRRSPSRARSRRALPARDRERRSQERLRAMRHLRVRDVAQALADSAFLDGAIAVDERSDARRLRRAAASVPTGSGVARAACRRTPSRRRPRAPAERSATCAACLLGDAPLARRRGPRMRTAWSTRSATVQQLSPAGRRAHDAVASVERGSPCRRLLRESALPSQSAARSVDVGCPGVPTVRRPRSRHRVAQSSTASAAASSTSSRTLRSVG